jgi:hypothetical protein
VSIGRSCGRYTRIYSPKSAPRRAGNRLSLSNLRCNRVFGHYAIEAGLQATILKPNDLLAWISLSQMYYADSQIAEAELAKSNATILGIGGKVDRNA